ncbi:uncharacterized protein BO97DRAFT_480165 [Aspergillus homomorphus CBS 101889]|uniref:Telomeric single stranded DNA binding POT1/Cdc13 domain-containing protein n=1 Tax=Aspergillus homomorphus (strain CBS 101889) TaxID=1450537 RepID=A0A395HMJ9_ASPHC|nr:hypothetical protein BO97DRAFT_480165 [Aspergillus homomorphus CBS 101889]RAL09162.1 hypothetical protein BO97DRAFT_480165 [Aspergillus homomorphus CBS 101889]
MDVPDQQQQPPASELLRSTTVPIAQLSPTLDGLSEHAVHGVVALLWPFSSSTRSISLLLAEPDFRLRRSGGQVRVVFHGHVAEEVAKSHVGIGDNIYLSLAGSRLADNDPKVLTPGKSVAWDVHFDSTVTVEIWRSDQHLSTIKIDPPSSPPLSADRTTPTPTTPDVTGSAYHRGLESAVWQSPAFFERSRTSTGGHLAGATLNSAFDPFAEEDGFVPGKGRKRARFSMRNDWRLVDEPASPEDLEIPGDWTAMFDDEAWLNEAAAELEEAAAADEMDATAKALTVPASPEEDEDTQPSVVPEDRPEPVSFASSLAPESSTTPVSRDEDSPEKSKPKSDAQFLLPDVSHFSRQMMHKTISSLAGHLPTDTPRLNPIPSPGLPIPSPLVSSGNSPLGYFGSVPVTSDPAQAMASKADLVLETSRSESQIGFDAELEFTEIQAQETPTVSLVSATGATNEADESASVSEAPETDVELPTAVKAASQEETKPSSLYHANTSPEGAESDREDMELMDGDSLQTEQFVPGGEHEPSDTEKSDGEAVDDHMPQGEEVYSDAEEVSEEVSDSEEHEDELASQGSETKSVKIGRDNEEDAREEIEPIIKSRADFEMDSGDEAESSVGDSEIPKRAEGHYVDDDEAEDHEEDVSDEGEFEELEEDEEDIDEEDEEGREEEEDMYDYEDEDGYGGRVDSEFDSQYTRDEAPQRKRNSPEIIVLDSDSEDEPADYSGRRDAGASDSDRSVSSADGALDSELVDGDEEEDYDEDEDENLVEVEAEVEDEDEDEDADEDAEDDIGSDVDEWPVQDEKDVQEPERSPAELRSDKTVHKRIEDVQSQSENASDAEEQLSDDEQAREEGVVAESIEGRHTETGEVDAAHTQTKEVEINQLDGAYDQERDGKEADHADHVHESGEREVPVNMQGHDLHRDQNSETDTGTQEIHTTTVVHGPDYESFEFVSSSAPAFDDNDHSTGPLSHFAETPIDPALLESTPVQAETHMTFSRHSPVNSEAQPEAPEPALAKEQPADAGLSLEGASSSLPLPIDLGHPSPGLQLDHQLITPEPSQLTGLDKSPPTTTAADEMPPTPEPTQEDAEMQDVSSEEYVSAEQDSEVESFVSAPSQREPHPHEGEHMDEDTEVHAAHSEDEVMLVGRDTPRIVAMNRNYPGLRSKLSYFAPLATLIDHYHALIDTISVVAEIRPAFRATSGKKDYFLTIGLTDPSLAGTVLFAQIFRSNKTALPSLTEGDAILLRDFQVKSFNHAIVLASLETSAWAVFSGSSAAADDAQVSGPPVEYGDEEETYATDLRQWYQETGMAMVADHQLQASVERDSRETTPAHSIAGLSESGSMSSLAAATAAGEAPTATARESSTTPGTTRGGSRRRKSHRRITIHELRDGRRYAEVGSPTSPDSIHELRDGTVYANL